MAYRKKLRDQVIIAFRVSSESPRDPGRALHGPVRRIGIYTRASLHPVAMAARIGIGLADGAPVTRQRLRQRRPL